MTHPLESAKRRRTALATGLNPRNGLDYVVTISGHIQAIGRPDPIRVRAKYVPDELIIAPSIFQNYLKTMAAQEWQSLEELAATLAGDVDSELLPRWIRIRLSTTDQDQEHSVDIEQTKPGWDNRMLLARLRYD